MPDPLATPYLTGNVKNSSPVKTQTLKGQCAQKSSWAYNWIADTFYYCRLNKWFKGQDKGRPAECRDFHEGFCGFSFQNYQKYLHMSFSIKEQAKPWKLINCPRLEGFLVPCKSTLSVGHTVLQGMSLPVSLFMLRSRQFQFTFLPFY